MAKDNVLTVRVSADGVKTETAHVFQHDHGMKLRIHGLDGAYAWTCHFAQNPSGVSVDSALAENKSGGYWECQIPDALLALDRNIMCFVHGHNASAGFTAHMVSIPLVPRAKPGSITYTTQELNGINAVKASLQSEIDALQALINEYSDNKIYLNNNGGAVTLTGASVVNA